MKYVSSIIIEMMIITCIFVFSGCSLTPQGKNASGSATVGPVNAPLSHTGPEFNIGTLSTYGTPLFTIRNSSDPHASIFNGVLYLYTSSDLNLSGMYPMSTTYCYATTDLINWQDYGAIISESQIPWSAKDNGLWAPRCVYANGQYYLYTPDDAANVSGPNKKRIGVSTAPNPWGPFTSQAAYINIPLPPNAPQGNFASDPFVFFDPNNNNAPYLLFCTGGMNDSHICIIPLNSDMLTVVSGSTPVDLMATGNNFPSGWTGEGSRLYYINNMYYLVYPSDKSASGNEEMVYATALNPMGPYTYKGVFMQPNASEFTIQGDIIRYDNKWVLLYHDTPLKSKGFKRMVCGEYFNFNSDGSIPNINRTVQGLTIDSTNVIQADTYFSGTGVTTEPTSDIGSAQDVTVQDGACLYYSGINLTTNNTGFTARVACYYYVGGTITVYLNDPWGPPLATISVSGTGGWQSWNTVSSPIYTLANEFVNGTAQICLKFSGSFNIDRFQFSGDGGVTTPYTYKIINKKSGRSIDMPGWSTSQGTQAQIYDYNRQANQEWTIRNNGPYVTIQNSNSGLTLGVAAASKSQGAQIVQWGSVNNPTLDQQWTLVPVPEPEYRGYYYIQDVNSGMVIGCSAGATTNGTRLIQWPLIDKDEDQMWSFGTWYQP